MPRRKQNNPKRTKYDEENRLSPPSADKTDDASRDSKTPESTSSVTTPDQLPSDGRTKPGSPPMRDRSHCKTPKLEDVDSHESRKSERFCLQGNGVAALPNSPVKNGDILQELASSLHSYMSPLNLSKSKHAASSNLKIDTGDSRRRNRTFGGSPHVQGVDQPLDLSCKSSVKDVKPKNYIEPDARQEEEASSSLSSLEERFGGNSYLLDGSNYTSHSKKVVSFSGFGGSLFSAALYHSTPQQLPEQPLKSKSFWPKILPKTTPTPSVDRKTPENRTAISKTQTSQTSPRIVKDEAGNKKYTNLICSCKKQFESLYEMTLHLQKSGHKPANGKREEQGEYPKLVRGQDMWLSQGSEQTRQILRCMHCGESFKTLPELTVHMMKTKHYTDIVGNSPTACELTENGGFNCKVCKEVFMYKENLWKHMKTHKSPTAKVKCETKSENLPQKLPCNISKFNELRKIQPVVKEEQDVVSMKRSAEFSEPSKDSEPLKSPRPKCRRSGESRSKRDSCSSDSSYDINQKNELDKTNQIRCENCSRRIATDDFVEHVRLCIRKNRDPEDSNRPSSSASSPNISGSERSPITKQLNGNHSPQLSIKCEPDMSYVPLHSTTPETESGSSALQAMESFIKRSFTPGKRETTKSQKITLPMSRHLEYVLPDSTEQHDVEKHHSKENDLVEKRRSKSDNQKHTDTKRRKNTEHENSGAYLESDTETKKMRYSYLADNGDGSGASSAIESLHGLVYGKTLATEHPLDSLQKLIHNTDTGASQKTVVSQAVITGTANLQPPLASTVILVNPIVTVMPSSNDDSMRIDISPKVKSPTSPRDSPGPPLSPESGVPRADGEFPEELRCQACKRTFASKGSYRYHLSRCHLSSVKKYGIKEAFNMSPYVYLPLDHSAKFNKYYEMANELANKDK